MTVTGGESFRVRKDSIRKNLLKYTRKAFKVLPELNKPEILDIGCGSGIPSLELARLCHGKITGIDIDQPQLDKFTKNIREAGLTDRVQALNCSMLEMDFPDEYFDIIWSEGSIYAVGFERGLREWKRFLKPGGFMVVHDEQGDVEQKIISIAGCGYELLDYFLISIEAWREEYFIPLENLVEEYKEGPNTDPENLQELKQAKLELDMFRKNPERNSSVYFIIKRT